MKVVMMLLAMVGSAQPASIYGRHIDASAVISGSPRLRDGNFQLSGKAAMCGEIPKEASLTGEATFVIELAGDTQGSMTTITFASKQLAGPKATASAFRLSVGVTSAQGGRPPLYVLNTDPARAGNSGVATLSDGADGTTLTVVGKNEANEDIRLTVRCR